MGKQVDHLAEVKGIVIVETFNVEGVENAFRISVKIINTTKIENSETISRDDVLSQSFLSTHIILSAENGEFISDQNPGELWEPFVRENKKVNSWPILIDKNNTTVLSSPIILNDYPEINPQSMGNLFDSTEIEEALLLHVNVLSEEEKEIIANSDEKLRAMLNKVSKITPEEAINLHGGFKDYKSQNFNK
ncbi:MAG: hypothetical protein M3R36_10910 [Bacteroidota bacterium]|nr:hypothetical protein [Bacteroidota bacterium]